jgi:hypothetical protein
MVSILFIFGGVNKDVNAQTCGGGTTTISTATTSVFNTGVSNQCLNITSSGSITVPDASNAAVYNNNSGFQINNAGTISTGTDTNAIKTWASGVTTNITNTGTISSVNWQTIYNNTGTIGSITNSGTISSTLTNAIWNNAATIGTITNTGTISSGTTLAFYNNGGTLATLNNSQGAGNSAGALTYGGALPTNYNIIITSPTGYGQLSGTGVTGSTAFGIYAGSVVTSKLYTGVLQGLTTSNVGATRTGTYSGLSWSLGLESGSASIWDLTFTGGSTADTQQSLVNTSQALQGTYALQNSVIANSFTYDCTVFGANNVCVSAGGRNTAVTTTNGLNNTSALLIAAYRPHPNYRIGAYADQNLSVSNPGGTVNLGNNTPLLGLFGAWNERLNGTGTEVKVAAAYGQKNATINRQVVGTSEAGTGSSQLNSQGAQLTAKYGFGIIDNVIVSPYVGVRYTQNNMGGYTEGTSTTVTAPLTYSALNTNATTALAGVGASYQVIPTVTTYASAGVESDTNTANGSYAATGVTGLIPVNFNANPVKTRPTATVGAYYDIEKNQRLGITGIYRQEAYQAISTTTVMATYTVGL